MILIAGLMAVWDELIAQRKGPDGTDYQHGYLSFEDGFELFNGYQRSYIPGTATREDQIRFQVATLNPVFGFRICQNKNP